MPGLLQRKRALQQLTSQTGKDAGQLLVSSAAFQGAVAQRYGGGAFTQRLFDSQDTGAELLASAASRQKNVSIRRASVCSISSKLAYSAML